MNDSLSNAPRGAFTGGGSAPGTPRLAISVAGVAFLTFFIAWIPLYNWLASIWNVEANPVNDWILGLVVGLFWLAVFALVLLAVWWSKAAFATWTTADLMLTAVIAAVFGFVFWAWAPVYNAAASLLGDWDLLMNGIWFVPAILIPLIVRKPGAALVGETLAGFVAMMIGSPWGFLGSTVAAMVQGMGAEVIFALTGWKRYDWLTLIAAGAGAAITGFVFVWPIWYISLSPDLLIIKFVGNLISVLGFAVVGSKLLGDALLATGVLNRFAIGRQRLDARAADDF
jgi:energy-coupling factor transport system permease protein